ncbi:hypothetical protein [Streptomyces griseoluteus]
MTLTNDARTAGRADRGSSGGIARIVGASLIGTTIEWYDNSFDRG